MVSQISESHVFSPTQLLITEITSLAVADDRDWLIAQSGQLTSSFSMLMDMTMLMLMTRSTKHAAASRDTDMLPWDILLLHEKAFIIV